MILKALEKIEKTELLKYYGTIKNLKRASIDDLVQQKGIGLKTAKRLYEFLKQN